MTVWEDIIGALIIVFVLVLLGMIVTKFLGA